jgi:hypothetical protein
VCLRGHLQRHVDVAPAGVGGQPDAVVQEHLMGAGLDQQRGRPASVAKTGLADGAEPPWLGSSRAHLAEISRVPPAPVTLLGCGRRI